MARTITGTDHVITLEDGNIDWFIIQTNRDVYTGYPDTRHAAAVKAITSMGQDKVALDGQNIIQDVLWQKGVLLSITIFTAQTTAEASQVLLDYFPPHTDQIQEL